MVSNFIKEKNVHQQIVDYLKYQYPKLLFRTDFAAGIKMTIGQAVKHKKLQQSKAWPDIFIAHPKHVPYINASLGLFLELKKNEDEIFKKDGTLKKDVHINEQLLLMEKLIAFGYECYWGLGFEATKTIIDTYLKGSY